VTLPKQNRPLVRDGRLQARKKRTDRSYLRPAPAGEPQNEPETGNGEEEPTASDVVRAAARAAAEAAPAAQPDTSSPAERQQPGKLPTAARALQQQGVRKRREFDIRALAIRDTNYAKHEIRRIATLAIMVIVTLIVLTFVLR
jgi:hypothetical protein